MNPVENRAQLTTRLLLPLVAALALLSGCADRDTELQQTHAYMDSLRLYLGDLRLMDYDLRQIVEGDTVSADLIIPVIAETLRPKVEDLRRRADVLRPTPQTLAAHTLLLDYLDARLQAYDAALQGQAEARPELFEMFAHKQMEAQDIGNDLEDEAQRLRTQIPDYR
ncbi:MAG: hypothetical protein O2782_22915 [bacterium]|nr:hypothetical protein [bacterium]